MNIPERERIDAFLRTQRAHVLFSTAILVLGFMMVGWTGGIIGWGFLGLCVAVVFFIVYKRLFRGEAVWD